MDEATRSLPLQPSAVIATLTPRQWFAVRVFVRQAAIKATKAQMQRQGLKPSRFACKDILAMAEDYARAHRAALVASAKAIAEQWQAEDEQRRQRRRERNSANMHSARRAD
jgi:hypothetical protein